ncbi:MAG: hypothetical protein KAG04_00100 [Mycoplasmataceae bacterium]|nr:hypothetical protein [Mycoplasmataceae bacterium]
MINRYINIIDRKILESKYGHVVNKHTISKVSRMQLELIFQGEDKALREKYILNVIQEWIDDKKNKDFIFNAKVKKVIKRTGIELTEVEKHNVFLFEEQIFSQDRHIKIIEVNEKLLKKEVVGAKFEKARLFELRDGKAVIIDKGTFLISNKRFLFTGKQEWSINYNKVSKKEMTDRGLSVIATTGEVKYIKIHDLITLENTINNIFGIKPKQK